MDTPRHYDWGDETLGHVYVYRNPGQPGGDLFDWIIDHTWARYIAFTGSPAALPNPERTNDIVAVGATVRWCHRRAVRAFLAQYRFMMIKPVLVAPLPPVIPKGTP